MDKRHDLRNALLRADGLTTNRVTDAERTAFQQILKQKQAHLGKWRIIMQSKITKLAAVAAVVLVSVVLFHYLDGGAGVTWAGVVEPLVNAQTVAFDLDSPKMGTMAKIRFMNQGGTIRSRQEIDTGVGKAIMIYDYAQSLRLTLSPEKKVAFFTNVQTDSPTQIHIGPVRELVTSIQEDPDLTIEQLDEQMIEGRLANVFRATSANKTLTVWTDAETLMPLRLEQHQEGQSMLMSNFKFDESVDMSSFSMETPQGYSTVQGQLDLTDLSEEDLTEGLRVWAQIFADNRFPFSLSPLAFMAQLPAYKQRLTEGKIVLTEQQKLDAGNQIAKLLTFVSKLSPEQGWHYVGASLPFGDATKPVCWYKPVDSQTYRVIYGDLSVKDVLEEDLPQ